jgi:hypothetical protein
LIKKSRDDSGVHIRSFRENTRVGKSRAFVPSMLEHRKGLGSFSSGYESSRLNLLLLSSERSCIEIKQKRTTLYYTVHVRLLLTIRRCKFFPHFEAPSVGTNATCRLLRLLPLEPIIINHFRGQEVTSLSLTIVSTSPPPPPPQKPASFGNIPYKYDI